MALKVNKIFESGLSLNDMYVKFVGFSGNKDNVRFLTLYYVNEEVYREGKSPLCDKEFSFTPSQDENALRWDKQAYEYAKMNIDEFKDAIDC
jgi:hypothetical protein